MPTVNGITNTTATNPFAPPATTEPVDPWGKDTFLKLLVAQLKYQDPTNPSDPQSFLSQTAQFSSVEKLAELADQMAATTRTAAVSTGAGLVGRQVTFATPDGQELRGLVSSASPTADGIVLHVGNHETTIDQIVTIH